MDTTTKLPKTHPTQHCTALPCRFRGLSHTAQYCGTPQPRKCKCVYCKQARRDIKAGLR